ncbi:UDP-N-acetylglucosamine--N-acetylmuramyl-(pentapeptide) pyrophosphoryl-undecaprenol N-acetylglucosamine transferase [Novosphingobium aromaticivorans DSM 12444]|uniref:UDP-N-acetylglucosamine--N-acetylmuramyl-(pentapeptide) pyrophosphoryl-undecaprenol N-acetylglucosamine transferase n=1 Tax=Novosphingobium aromaticivorans (strain ATCC 700278 / DSM 12444 / CCUG 56034 / CIP 105152 / NBRC 16084 / F199) TaxID=279238 RepID=MURG_NOVAD|nr:undecaprenyldiphospho-muramoylpentapeptide beta-N-acetylglucosaminyltransferase [Novosphingobium aromaticivorans]Q2G995.1 RecName: Full=UDP-N-acetylglucosamine--N-acetylmuramyl-(pentapeptide) pyrophosphoryl-undecaprenol N-acetylglucosamine transferase; AltName: Full=Undecaprenyl-PP-MurNAc-pentapeptide-UDPGlcNAc GlcNAc transferase [Novosphingobium aromaticivorans DSM 12444]ABD25578.1 UDP-N-acetylglucosamine--N-acetylmuramyl-(pentapeptide) pyrophosphoryl-undecaprenol N-acetylglucosamine transfer
MTTVSRHYVLAAGGTGGHLIPAFALAVELDRRGHHVALVTDERGAKIPGKPDFLPAHVLPAGRLGKNPVALFKGLRAIWQGRAMALRLFESFEPSCVIGFGGYPALPALLAAHAARIPTVIHEQNAVLGRVNRLLAKRVDAIATAYGEVDRLDPKLWGKVHRVGNPVRPDVLALRGEPFPEFTEDSLFRVLVTGGSQGASILSEVVPDGLAMLPPALRHRLQVTQQCRPEDLEVVRARYAAHEIPAELGTYFEDMQARLAGTHLFIGRAGASTIAELTAVGRPAILVPLPIATDDHQAANTREVVAAGGARAIRQSGFTPKELAKQIQAMAQHPHTLANAAHAAWNCGLPNAVKDLADLVESFGASPIMDVIRLDSTVSAASGQEQLA